MVSTQAAESVTPASIMSGSLSQRVSMRGVSA